LIGLSIGPLDGLSGAALVAGLCLLLFVEELGVPLPFAPGDVVLIACGLTAAADHLNAPITLLALNASVVARALVGREFFARVGEPIAQRLVDLLRIRAAFNRLVGALSRMGWLGVLVGRFTPGPPGAYEPRRPA